MFSWEEAVCHIRRLPAFQQLVYDAYLDEDPVTAARRYAASEEWRAVLDMVMCYKQGNVVLDVGAGNGLASYAFAINGYSVHSLEPCDGETVGRGAIEKIMRETGVSLNLLGVTGEKVPLPDESIDIVFARQVLHHAADLPAMCRELYRVLKHGGVFLAVREHVISSKEDLPKFLAGHPLHKFYGGENAYMLQEYRGCLEGAGFEIVRSYGPWESDVNLAPLSAANLKTMIIGRQDRNILGALLKRVLQIPGLSDLFIGLVKFKNRNIPGRLYSFLSIKR